jgi:hypothetical protein
MQHARFFDWLTDVTPNWLARLVAGVLLLGLLAGAGLGVRAARQLSREQAQENARLARELGLGR